MLYSTGINRIKKVVLPTIIIIALFCIISQIIYVVVKPRPLTLYYTSDGNAMYVKENRNYVISDWCKINDKWYYFDAAGHMVKGEATIGGNYYIFGKDGALENNWAVIDGQKVYMLSDKTVVTGWYDINGFSYYFNPDGTYVTGKNVIDGETFYFRDDGTLGEGWIDDKIYVNQDGTIMSGWVDIEGNTYYLKEDGTKYSGWLELDDEKYYIDANGQPAIGSQKIGDTYYIFDNTGRMINKDSIIKNLNGPALEHEFTSYSNDTKYEETGSIVGIGGYKPDNDVKNQIKLTMDKIYEDYPDKSIGFVMIDLYTGEGMAYNIDNYVYAASCIKAPYVVSLVNEDPSRLEELRESIEAILVYSDNDLYSSFRSRYGQEPFLKFTQSAGLNDELSVYNYPHITPRILAAMWIENYFILNTTDAGIELGKIMMNPEDSSIHDILSGAKAYTQSKVGWISEPGYISTNDGGIVYPVDSSPYVIAITSDLPSDIVSIYPIVKMIDKLHDNIDQPK